MLRRAYHLRQAINLFVSSADELFGPITSIRCHGQVTKHIPWTAFALKTLDWECVNDTRIIISDANDIQQYFSSEQQPMLWRTVETRVSLSMHYRILSLPKHHPALILRTSLVPPHTFIFIFHRFSARASRSVTHFLSIPCPLVFIGAFLMLFPFI
ncbi:hypothetical protein P692DRAFT_20756371 [Suillus brevipes Sb2]|nr:hypothetical protein P692DRAFT_20756371 [Suillus brevipes Sb2]